MATTTTNTTGSTGGSSDEYKIQTPASVVSPLSDRQSLLATSVLDLFSGYPTKRKLTLWTDDAVFADPLTIATGRRQFESQWYGLKAVMSKIERLETSVVSSGNPIELRNRIKYTVRGVGMDEEIESKVLIHTTPDGSMITKVEDRWGGKTLPDGAFAKAMRNLNSVTVPTVVSVPNSVEEEEAGQSAVGGRAPLSEAPAYDVEATPPETTRRNSPPALLAAAAQHTIIRVSICARFAFDRHRFLGSLFDPRWASPAPASPLACSGRPHSKTLAPPPPPPPPRPPPPPPFRPVARARSAFSLLRYFFPSTHARVRTRYLAFRHETFPHLRHRTQSRIWQAILRRERRKRERRAAGRGFRPFLQRRTSGILRALYGQNAAGATRGTGKTMNNYGQPRVPGARREKVFGYLRAANEIRQSYQATLQQRLQAAESDGSMPGDFPDFDVVRSGDEEMVLFPSYARAHIKRAAMPRSMQPGTDESIGGPNEPGDQDYWRREWEKFEDANAIVDVDVRGWIFAPQQGPLNRKNRLMLAVARRLSGIYPPAQEYGAVGRDSGRNPDGRSRMEDESTTRHEDEIAAREAENIARHGQREADAASRGNYSHSSGRGSGFPSANNSRSNSPTRSLAESDLDPGQQAINKRQSWNEPAAMSNRELAAANELLLSRLKPFMSVPTVNAPITVFFFNNEKSTSKTVTTDESGYFNLRAALDFVPTQVRVLASDKLSATEDVIITENKGISLVSDIDDTIKHSAIASGAREIFKNTFIRELGDLTIQGVKEWYTRLAGMGVQMHYVSNSPWQLYPLITSYFKLAGIPPGSFHLKQYSGMLQGIFEPAAERKRGSLDRILADFPERKFILVGDSGEADLEVYTDVVLENPGRVLGVFIRDVTTPAGKGFFDRSVTSLHADSTPSTSKDGDRRKVEDEDAPERRPALPTRPVSVAPEEDLIDFSDEPEPKPEQRQKKPNNENDLRSLDQKARPNGTPPAKPNKPSSLRNFSTTSQLPTNHDRRSASSDTESQSEVKRKPPPPPKPRRSSNNIVTQEYASANTRVPSYPPRQNPGSSTDLARNSSAASSISARQSTISRSSTSTSNASFNTLAAGDDSYLSTARRQLVSAYNALPALRAQSPSRPDSAYPGGAPGAPPRRGIAPYQTAAAAARWATGATGGDPAAGGDGGAMGAPYDRKLEMWRRRWERAEEIMRERGVVLRTWRVGSDVMGECVALVEKELNAQKARDLKGAKNGRDDKGRR